MRHRRARLLAPGSGIVGLAMASPSGGVHLLASSHGTTACGAYVLQAWTYRQPSEIDCEGCKWVIASVLRKPSPEVYLP